MMGRKVPEMEVVTTHGVFLIDPDGVFRAILYYPQEIGRNMDEMIIPPAQDVETAKKRTGQDGCFDWWFCHKKL